MLKLITPVAALCALLVVVAMACGPKGPVQEYKCAFTFDYPVQCTTAGFAKYTKSSDIEYATATSAFEACGQITNFVGFNNPSYRHIICDPARCVVVTPGLKPMDVNGDAGLTTPNPPPVTCPGDPTAACERAAGRIASNASSPVTVNACAACFVSGGNGQCCLDFVGLDPGSVEATQASQVLNCFAQTGKPCTPDEIPQLVPLAADFNACMVQECTSPCTPTP